MREPRPDAELVDAVRRGDRHAFRLLVERHQRRVYAVALGMLRHREDARDACQESFLRAYQHLGAFKGDASFSTWLHRIVINTCLDELRRRRPGRTELDETLPTSEPGPADQAAFRQLHRRVADALDRLSDAHRTVLVLREVEGLSYDQIAGIMGCPSGTVMSRLHHARRRMQALLSVPTAAAAAAA